MLEFLVVLFGSFLAGFAAKTADEFEKIKKLSSLAYIFSFVYSLILGILSCFFNLATLYVSLALANAVAGKIDSKTHLAGFFIFTAMIVLFDINLENLWLFGLFFIAGFLDEMFSSSKIIFLRERIILPLMTMLALMVFSSPIYFFSIVSFDLGYKLFIFLKPQLIRNSG
ncbi:MAG: hypothetical protein QXV64_00075 [Candidatus Anstonellaceae archaeon]